MFTTLGIAGFTQCSQAGGPSVRCGTVTDADFFVDVTRVPEPTTLALFGIALLAWVGFRRKA